MKPMVNAPHSSSEMRVLLAAMYLAGAPRSHELRRDRWPGAASLLQSSGARLAEAPAALREGGYWSEALALETPGLLPWAQRLLERGHFLTAACPGYPSRWFAVFPAPVPALWKRGEVPRQPFLSVVGSRHIDGRTRIFAAEISVEANRLGFSVVSGGAVGCDRAAVSRVSECLEILPCGLGGAFSGRCQLSARPPREAFSVSNAMERNALIYAASDHTVVAHARFKHGGAWTGATEALRRRSTRLLVGVHSEEAALRALVALGAVKLGSPKGLAEAMAEASRQAELFGP